MIVERLPVSFYLWPSRWTLFELIRWGFNLVRIGACDEHSIQSNIIIELQPAAQAQFSSLKCVGCFHSPCPAFQHSFRLGPLLFILLWPNSLDSRIHWTENTLEGLAERKFWVQIWGQECTGYWLTLLKSDRRSYMIKCDLAWSWTQAVSDFADQRKCKINELACIAWTKFWEAERSESLKGSRGPKCMQVYYIGWKNNYLPLE